MAATSPLDGLRVIDLTRVLAGPYCTMLLADMGADVIKVEDPRQGDEMRGWAPVVNGTSFYFAGVNRGKRSIVLDLRSVAGADVLRKLARTADVLVENFRPGGLARLGFGYDSLHVLNPRLVYCSISGYGQTGPRRDEPGYDPIIQAESGLMDVTGMPDGPATRVGVPIVDYLVGLQAIQGILLALMQRQHTQEAQHVDISLLDCTMSTMIMQNGLVQAFGAAPRRGNEHPAIAPYETLRASDGVVMVAAGNERLWRQLCTALNGDHLADDSRFATNGDRLEHRQLLREALERLLAALTVDEAVGRLNAAQVPCGRVRTAAEALADPQLEARQMFVSFDGIPNFRALAYPLRFSAMTAQPARRPPTLGEHTREILAELGYAPPEIDGLSDAASVDSNR